MALDKIKTDIIADDAVTIAKMNTDTGVQPEHIKVPVYADDAARDHNTTGIPSPTVGMMVYNTDKGVVQQYNAQGWASIDSPPTVTSLDYPGSSSALDPVGEFTDATCDYNNDPTITHDANTNIREGMTVKGTGIPTGATVSSVTSNTQFELSVATTGGAVTNGTLTFNSEVLIISGTNFQTGATVTIDSTAPSIITRNSSSQITITGMPAKTAGTYADGLKVINPTGLSATINVDYSGVPTWTNASGNLLDDYTGTISEINLNATNATTYAITSGALPTGLSMATSDGDITGNMTAGIGTYNFTVTASDAESQSSARLFNIISKGTLPTGGNLIANYSSYRVHKFTAGGNFVVTSALTADILIIGGGGGTANNYGGGGGAGQVIWGTGVTVSAGTHPVVIGLGGTPGQNVSGQNNWPENRGNNGGDSSFAMSAGSTITYTAGGGGGSAGYEYGDPPYHPPAAVGSTGGTGIIATTISHSVPPTPSGVAPSGGNVTGTWNSYVYTGTKGTYNSGWSSGTGGRGGGGGGGSGGTKADIPAPSSVTVAIMSGGPGRSTIGSLNATDTAALLWAAQAGTNASNAATSGLSSNPGTLYIAGGGGAAHENTTEGLGGVGGGGNGLEPGPGTNGLANTGGGGGGHAAYNKAGTSGGTGIVIIRYAA